MTDQLEDRILASLLAAGMGDALGAPTEQWTIDEILEAHGGLVTEFRKPTPDTFAGANDGLRAEVTDDASQMYYLSRALVRSGGELTLEQWVACLLDWAGTSPKATFMGPSTLLVVQALRAGQDVATVGVIGRSRRKLTSVGNTNGAAMRIAPAGLVHPGDIEAAVAQALITCMPTHDTNIAVASAGAIAAGVAAALVTDDYRNIVAACLEGAALGERLAVDRARIVPGPGFRLRLELALEIAARETEDIAFLRAIDGAIGASVLAVESVPAAVAILAYAKGDPMRTISLSASVGNDTDSVATMAGALAGALKGTASLPPVLASEFRSVNEPVYDIAGLAKGIADIARRNLEGIRK